MKKRDPLTHTRNKIHDTSNMNTIYMREDIYNAPAGADPVNTAISKRREFIIIEHIL